MDAPAQDDVIAATVPLRAEPGEKFDDPALADELDAFDVAAFDELDFGVIGMDRDGTVIVYNRDEAARAGLDPARVLGRHFFTDVGPCTDNALVAGRYAGQDALDVQLDYVFTFRLTRTPVRLRLLARSGSPRQYLLVRPR